MHPADEEAVRSGVSASHFVLICVIMVDNINVNKRLCFTVRSYILTFPRHVGGTSYAFVGFGSWCQRHGKLVAIWEAHIPGYNERGL